jgi:phosphoribosyl 1,2-cyclic phosphodiesterase
MTFSVRFWGVRGSIACSGPRTARYGGNTSSLEVRCGDRVLLFDAGTGMRYLGNAMDSSGPIEPIEADVFLTHTHYDHVCGIPFFRPFFRPSNRFRLWAGHLGSGMTLRRVMDEFMVAPLFPVPPQVFKATVDYKDFACGKELSSGPDVRVKTIALNHPDGATGYRVEFDGKAFCYLTDTEHVPGAPDRKLAKFMEGADAVVYDSMYTDDEYPKYVGWGHSTWQEGVRLCKSAGVKKLVVFHHDPEHTDEMLDGIGKQVEKELPGSVIAREGLVLEL